MHYIPAAAHRRELTDIADQLRKDLISANELAIAQYPHAKDILQSTSVELGYLQTAIAVVIAQIEESMSQGIPMSESRTDR
jgi:hypothetical protein